VTGVLEWLPAGPAAGIASRKCVRVAGSDCRIAVFRAEDGNLYAIEDRCPHRGARLSNGAVFDNDRVACPDHGWTIRLADGGVEPPDQGQVRTFEVKVEDGVVYVRVAPAPPQLAGSQPSS
jgi:nitrite reductase (NADH) small subunit